VNSQHERRQNKAPLLGFERFERRSVETLVGHERRDESLYVAPLIDAVCARGYRPETVAMDKGYDNNRVMDETRERGCVPIVCLRKRTADPAQHDPLRLGQVEAPLPGRAAVEREFGRLKHEYGLAPLHVRGLAKVALHADLTMPARLGLALTRARTCALGAHLPNLADAA